MTNTTENTHLSLTLSSLDTSRERRRERERERESGRWRESGVVNGKEGARFEEREGYRGEIEGGSKSIPKHKDGMIEGEQTD